MFKIVVIVSLYSSIHVRYITEDVKVGSFLVLLKANRSLSHSPPQNAFINMFY